MTNLNMTLEESTRFIQQFVEHPDNVRKHHLTGGTRPFIPAAWLIDCVASAYAAGACAGIESIDATAAYTPSPQKPFEETLNEKGNAAWQRLGEVALAEETWPDTLCRLIDDQKATLPTSGAREALNLLEDGRPFGMTIDDYARRLIDDSRGPRIALGNEALIERLLKTRGMEGSNVETIISSLLELRRNVEAAGGWVGERTAVLRERAARELGQTEGYERAQAEVRARPDANDQLADLAMRMYDAAGLGFHTAESDGSLQRFRVKARFSTLADMQDYYAAWVHLMVACGNQARAQEKQR